MAEPVADKGAKTYGDDELLNIVADEARVAVGFENDSELQADRERALNYFKGDMSKDIPALPNRSKAVATVIADAVGSAMPDLMEIFTGGEDVVAFTANSPEDEEQARQETDYLQHVLFQDNAGFLNLYTATQDALVCKTGVFTAWWEKKEKIEEERFAGKNAAEVQLAGQDGEIIDLAQDHAGEGEEPTFSFTLKKTTDLSYARYQAVPPEDLAIARDTIDIQDASYCSLRSRPRVQDLIADGFDEAKVRSLPPYAVDDKTLNQARDTAGEHSETTGDDTNDDLRQVEIKAHYIRLLEEGNDLCLYRVVTDAESTKILKSEKVSRIPIYVGTPFIVPHRMHGQSLADKLVENQKIMTALRRALLDSAYFSLNQRLVVADSGRNDFTISDILNNTPGLPIRAKTVDAVSGIKSGGLAFDPYAALEYFATVTEQASGIIRNSQGLNPDTLHDTAKGAMAMLQSSQKRIRMIARVLAETCIKPLYLGIHALLRENARAQRIVKLRGKWVEVNPSKWAERNSMTIEVGLGASGVEADMAKFAMMAGVQEKIVAGQGGGMGPIVFPENVYALAHDMLSKLSKKSDGYLTDPKSQQGQMALQAQANKPDPEMAKVQVQAQAKQAELQIAGQMKSAQMQQEGQIKQQQTQADAELELRRLSAEMELKRYQVDQELMLKREQLAAELQLKREELAAELELKRQANVMHAANESQKISSSVRPGGEPG